MKFAIFSRKNNPVDDRYFSWEVYPYDFNEVGINRLEKLKSALPCEGYTYWGSYDDINDARLLIRSRKNETIQEG